MIEAKNVTMCFEGFTALDNLSCQIPSGCIYGLVGSNGAGKSTFLRLISGIYRPKDGEILIDGLPVYDNPEAKSKLFFIPDELYFLPQSTMNKMAAFYRNLYPSFSMERFHTLTQIFGLNPRSSIQTFSKGMRRQAATILGLSIRPRYLFFDETFDGLDPVMRNLVKDVIRADAKEFGTTVIIASHSLRELEDVCDQLSLLHKGGIVFESQMSELKTSLFKVQFALSTPYDESLFARFDVKKLQKRGAVTEMIIRGEEAVIMEELRALHPVFLESLPLGLEEVFIYEMEALGYAFSEVLQ